MTSVGIEQRVGVVDEAEEDAQGLFREGEPWGMVGAGHLLLLGEGRLRWPSFYLLPDPRNTHLADGVLLGTHDRADAAVAGQLLNYMIRAVGMELKVKEATELEERLEQLEALLDQKDEARGWG